MKSKCRIFSAVVLCGTLLLVSNQASAFACSVNGGPSFYEGSKDIYVNVKTDASPGGDIILDTGNQIECWHEGGAVLDVIFHQLNSRLDGPLSGANNAYIYNNSAVNFPKTKLPVTSLWANGHFAWYNPGDRGSLKIYITIPLKEVASGTSIGAGSRLATLFFMKGVIWGGPDDRFFNFNIYSSNDLNISTGGCDVSTKKINVNMGSYPTNSSEQNINLSLQCTSKSSVVMKMTGPANGTVFTNTATTTPASGLGFEMLKNGRVLQPNTDISLGNLGPGSEDLGLKVRYARTGGTIKAGNVQSVIKVNFVYN